MIFIRTIMLLVAGVLAVSAAQAEVIQAGKVYSGGVQLELPGSKTTFVVPAGWNGIYNAQAKLFQMNGPAGESVALGYKGKRFEDAIASASNPITTSDGVVLNPIHRESFNQRISGELFVYSGKAMLVMNVTAVAAVIKTPEGKAVTMSSMGLGQNPNLLSQQMGKVTPTVNFTSRPTRLANNQPSSQTGASHQSGGSGRSEMPARHNSGQYVSNAYVNGKIAGIPVVATKTIDPLGPPDWVRIEKGDPFAGAFGNTSDPRAVDHMGQGLCPNDEYGFGTVAYGLEKYILVNSANTRRVRFCSDGGNLSYRGRFQVDERKSAKSKWHRVDQGRYQMFGASPDREVEDSCDNSDISVLFLDRVDGEATTTLAQEVAVHDKDVDGVYRAYWGDRRFSFGGEIYSSNGVNTSCENIDVAAESTFAECEKTAQSKAERESCWGKAWPDKFYADGSNKPAPGSRNGRETYSSGPGGQSVFGTTSDGRMILSTPNGGLMF